MAWLLYPFALLYQAVVVLRNRLFDTGMLSTEEFDLPVISIGNITVGGTGKTPHTEYLLALLSAQFKTAVLSRGYKRKSKGFHLVSVDALANEVGDEPLQIKRKFPDVLVAVDANRREGIRAIRAAEPGVQLIILDDAFQHRWVKPGLSILLIDFHRNLRNDKILPVGRLREPIDGKKRANILVYTKCPPDIKPIDRRILMKEISPDPLQTVHFSTLVYGNLQPVFRGLAPEISLVQLRKMDAAILLVTGIANPAPVRDFLSDYTHSLRDLVFPDHYAYTPMDMLKIIRAFDFLQTPAKILLTTEKDAVRMESFEQLDEDLRQKMYYLPVKVRFVDQETGNFNQEILNYVSNFKLNSAISSFAHQPKA
jgi:tetraacyldisaccharide 4'-kinase